MEAEATTALRHVLSTLGGLGVPGAQQEEFMEAWAQAHDAKRLEEQFQGKMEEIGAWGIAMDAGVAVPCTAGVIGEKAAIAQMLGGKDVPVQVAG